METFMMCYNSIFESTVSNSGISGGICENC